MVRLNIEGDIPHSKYRTHQSFLQNKNWTTEDFDYDANRDFISMYLFLSVRKTFRIMKNSD